MEQRESLEIVIFRHLAWRPERFQLQLKKGVSRMGAANWAAALGVVQQSSRCQRRFDHRRDRGRRELFALRQTWKFETFSPT
jgi:hypothetical protein